MSKIQKITAANGAIVDVVLDQIDGDDSAAIEVARACVEALTYTYDEPGDVYKQINLSSLLEDLWRDRWGGSNDADMDKAEDGATSGHKIDIGGHTALWHSGISSDPCLSIMDIGTTIEDWVRSWEDDGAREYCEAWGFGWDDGSAEVDDDFEGEVAIQVTPHFFDGTLGTGTKPHLLRDDDGEVMIFSDAAAAKSWITEDEDNVYTLRHGEYARPDYMVIDANTIPA